MLLRNALWMRAAHFLSLHKILRKFINLKLFILLLSPPSIKIFELKRSLREMFNVVRSPKLFKKKVYVANLVFSEDYKDSNWEL